MGVLDFRYVALFRNRAIQSDWGRKLIEAKFRTFSPLYILAEGWAQYMSEFYELGQDTLLTGRFLGRLGDKSVGVKRN